MFFRYFGIGLHALLVLMVNYFGGIRQLLLRFNGSRFKISTGPLCCLFLCLPTFKMTKYVSVLVPYSNVCLIHCFL